MTIIIQCRKEGMRVGGCGGLIRGAFETLQRLEKPPELEWRKYLLNEFGPGEFFVTKCAGNKNIQTLFKGKVGLEM